jgi:hypothetical protein
MGGYNDGQERWDRIQAERRGVHTPPSRQAGIQQLFSQKAALETLVRKLEREGADESEIRPYAQQLQDVKARLPINRPVVR